VLYGRDAERAQVWALLEDARSSRSGALVIRGEAGIGKSALLADARDRAADMNVLSARGVESESELPFAALHQLLRPALGQLDRLPAPQAAALGSALGLDEKTAEERFLVFAACLSLLSELAERRPVLCLVDDAHWLDAASADALRFVARRLEGEGIVMLFGARESDVRAFDAPDVPSLVIGGLGLQAATQLLARGVDVAPSVRDRLVSQTEGNALALVELPAALTPQQLAGQEPLPEALPMTRQLESIFHERVRHLPEDTRRFLLLAAADDSEDVRVVTAAAERLGTDVRALDAAEQARLVSVRGTQLEFRHPLVRSAVYGAAASSERRAAHGALAEALAGADEYADRRAWHLASATLEHDEEVVRALDDAARRAEERAGHSAAAKALQRAAELVDDSAEQAQRLVRAARDLGIAGRDEEALAVADRAEPIVTDPVLHAELAHVRGVAAVRRGRPHELVAQLVDAAREVGPVDPAKAVELLIDASSAAWQGADLPSYLEAARLASTIEPPPGDEVCAVLLGSLTGFERMIAGDFAAGVPRLEKLVELGAIVEEPRHVVWANFGAAWIGDERRVEQLLERAVVLSRRRGELGTLAEALAMRATQLILAQRYDEATVAAGESIALARELDAENLTLLPLSVLAVVSAVQGRDEEARRHSNDVIDRANAKGFVLRATTAVYALALVELGGGRWDDALERLNSILDGEAASLDPMAPLALPNKIEAAVRASKPDEARAALLRLEGWVGSSRDGSAQARLAACRALLADGEEAGRHYEAALELSAHLGPFDLARIRLLYGEDLRRNRRRTDARAQLRAALEGFERLRAEPWAERARGELRATGETARKRDASTVDQLTPQELQISRYVAEGMSNKEIAAHLFLSPRTIDSHLRNVFSKLGIRSRTQLARMPLGGDDTVAAEVGAPPVRA
jgi:DNA-binding CsgD family transcriptional regulator